VIPLAVGAILIVAIVVLAVLARRRGAPAPAEVSRDAPTLDAPPRARPRLGTRIGGIFRRDLDEAFWGDLEEALIAADVGVATSTAVVAAVRDAEPSTTAEARATLRSELLDCFADADRSIRSNGSPGVVVVVGVNGSGKTTTIAKLASELIAGGSSVLVGAADTFRAAAAEQMVAWGDRIGFDVVRGGDGADPASVAFDARSAAAARGRDVLIVDTAGRLHSKQNLMDELGKIVRVLSREEPPGEVLLVLDGSIGQNGIVQARAFTEAVGVTGTVITKLDGSGKGGVAVAVERDLGIPVKLIGVGEGSGDLLHFDPERFVAYGSSMCAEATAIGNAVSNGVRKIDTVAVSCIDSDTDTGYPCGNCRQLMVEFGVERLLVDGPDGVVEHTLDDVIPFGFKLD
jgi:fused signal recognition particle receptor